MNKWILALLLVLVFVVVYFMLPKEIYVKQQAKIRVNSSTAYRFLADEDEWGKWWPRNIKDKPHAHSFEEYTYNLQQNFFQSLVIDIRDDNRSTSSTLSLIPLGVD